MTLPPETAAPASAEASADRLVEKLYQMFPEQALNEAIAEITRLAERNAVLEAVERAARIFQACLSPDCDIDERFALREALAALDHAGKEREG